MVVSALKSYQLGDWKNYQFCLISIFFWEYKIKQLQLIIDASVYSTYLRYIILDAQRRRESLYYNSFFSLGDFKETVRNETDSLIDRLFGKSSIETRRDLQSKQTEKSTVLLWCEQGRLKCIHNYNSVLEFCIIFDWLSFHCFSADLQTNLSWDQLK